MMVGIKRDKWVLRWVPNRWLETRYVSIDNTIAHADISDVFNNCLLIDHASLEDISDGTAR